MEPIAETSLSDAFGYPIYCVVVADKVVAHVGHLYKPRFARVVDKRSIAAPAERIIVFKLRRVKQKSLFFKVFKHHRVGFFDENSRIGGLLGHISLAVNKLNKGEVVTPADARVVLTERRRAVNDTRTVGHCYIAVAHNEVSLFVLLFADGLYKVKQRLVFFIFKLAALKFAYYLISLFAFFGKSAENLIKQSLCYIIGVSVRRLYLAVGFVGVYAKRNV